ncbi:MAG TPA: phosphate transport system regulatory protein PhoU, partial [Acholeplasmataceae bacterium]|nr:phosphate transport system regulatory protein PhoU [Acholeplasmataceae bacterium]
TMMSESAYQMVLNAINAFVKQDLKLAKQVIEDDDIVDNQFNDVMASVTEQIKNDSIDSQYAVSVIMVAKYMERIADHAVNLAEWTIFMITGEHKKTPLF